MNESWVEKYRPKQLDEVESQDEIITSLKNCIKTKNIPHMLFFGPSGCGKTSAILALAREIFGARYWDDRVIELNASDERGIKVVREKIKRYAMNSINDDPNIPPFKLIILDEADNMTGDSQFALRKIMEDCANTRFCIICNYHNKIIDPIISRCSVYRFKPVPKENIHKKLKEICVKEGSIISDETIEMVEQISRGDMRKAINFLQRCRNFKNFISDVKKVDSINNSMVEMASGMIENKTLVSFIEDCIKGNMDNVNKMIDMFYNESYSLTIQISTIINYIINKPKMKDNHKALICDLLLSIDNYLLNGCDESIQYNRLAYGINNIVSL
jgi:replication factor C subunit 2/4